MSNKRITVSVNKLSNNVVPKSEEEKGLKKVDVGLASSREELASIAKYKKLSASEQRNILRQQQGLPVSIDVDEEKKTDAAKRNAIKISTGRPLEITDGQIYTFEPLTKDSLQKSIAWADSEIEKLKSQGGSSSILGEIVANIGNIGNPAKAMTQGKVIGDASKKLRELESQRAVYSKYLDSVEADEILKEIEKNGDGELFSELFRIDSEKPTVIDALSNIGSTGNVIPSRRASYEREAEIKTELQEKYGDRLNKYRDVYAKQANDEFTAHLVKKQNELIDEHPALGSMAYTVSNIATAPLRGIGAVSDSVNKAMGNYGAAGGSVFQNMSETTVQRVNEDINEKFKNPYAAGFVRTVYNAAVSGAESLMTMGTFGKFGEAILGLNAATSTYKQSKERGLSDGQALASGIAAGIFETLFEHMSLEKLRVFQASPATTLKPFINNILKQSFTEGLEELGTDVANEAYDYFVNGGLSQYEEALRNGMTSKEYGKQFLAQLGETVLTGALSGGGMVGVAGAPSAISGSIAESRRIGKVGKSIKGLGITGQVLQDAKKQGGITGKKAAYIEKQIAEGKSVSDKAIGKIALKTTKQMRTEALDNILSGEEYSTLSQKEKNAIRSSVLTFFNNPMKLDDLQRDVLQTENGKSVLKGVYEWQKAELDKKVETVMEEKTDSIRAALTEGNTEALVKNTFEAVTADGHTVAAGAVRDIVDGELEIVQDRATGATAKLSQLKIQDEDAGKLYNALQRAATGNSPMTADAMNVAIAMYNRNENNDPEAYISWAHDAYKAGCLIKDSTVLSFPEFERMFEGSYSGDITREQLYSMYEAGAKNLELKPGVTIIGAAGVTKQQSEQLFIINEVARKSGLQVVVVNGELTDADGKGVNGLYKAGTNRIVLSLDNENDLILTHAGHEMFHWAKEQDLRAKEQDPKWGQFLQNTVINVLKSDSKYDFEGIYRETAEAYEGCSEAEILEEIAAKYLGVAFSGENNIRRIVDEASAEERSFLKKLIARLKEFIDDIKQRMKLYASTDKTVSAAVETPTEQLDYIADMFMRALTEAGKTKKPTESDGGVKASLQKSDIEEKKDIRYSYAGVKAKTADIKSLDYAIRLEDVGKASPEEIRQQTGWFRGYDNKWRFEISDRDMQIDTRGLFSSNPDIRRYNQLVDKAYVDMTATEEEMQELLALDKNLDGVSLVPKTLGELIHHPTLFEAYPQLKNVSVVFEELPPGIYGEYRHSENEIAIKKGADKNLIRGTILHEVQHAIQRIEGFAGGTSVEYWAQMPAESKPGTYAQQVAKRNKIGEKLLQSASVEFVDAFRAYNRGDLEFSDLEKIGTEDELDLLYDYDEADREASYLRLNDRSDHNLYMSTAGEIEARDTVSRQNLNAEERKNTRPNIDRTDVVFAGMNNSAEIVILDNGKQYVRATEKVIKGDDSSKWPEMVADYINRILRKYKDFKIFTVEGDFLTLTRDTAYKAKTRNFIRNSDGSTVQMNDEDFRVKLNAEIHINELAEIAKKNGKIKPDYKKHAFAKDGFEYRTVFFQDFDGKYYKITVSIGKNGDVNTVYNVGKIKKDTLPHGNIVSVLSGSKADSMSSNSLTQSAVDVKTKYSRQRLGNAWEDIRTKMYENQVHEDIINEVEEHIGKLRRANITREEELTGGLIPKYEALLKLAREHTKGSEVSATRLADTLNDLVWAAHDGNLDTKQFISTVRVIAEEIISTGKVLNDDMYREYEEFRKMSREETVYVSQEVYDQYVEEYTTARNLNRACAGKIKIKPYTESNRTGRALDDFYAELVERFPALFKEDVDIYHQLYEILNAWQAIQPYAEYYSDLLGVKTKADLEHAALMKAEEILSEVLGITDTVKTIADKYADKLKYQQEHYKEYYRKQAEEGRKKRQEAEEKAIVLKRIQRNTKRFSNMIIEETDQRHIPEKLKKPVMNFLNMVMFENSDGREAYHVNGTLNMLELMYAYKSYYNPSGKEGSEKAEYDEDVVGWIEELAMTFGEHLNINRLDIEDLRKVDTIVQHLAHIIKHENDIFVDGKREKYRALAEHAINEMMKHAEREEFRTEKLLRDLEYDMLTPIYFFKHIGTATANGKTENETLFRLYRDLQTGQDKWYRNIKTSRELLADIKKRHNYTEAWRTEAIEFELDSGEKIQLTPEEIMYMKALYVRESKHINNINHLLSGGIIIESDGRLENMQKKKEAFEATKARRREFAERGGYSVNDICNALRKKLTADDLLKIFNSLTDDMIGYQESLVQMMSTKGAEMGNQVSMELLGIKKFTEKNYIPISVAEDMLQFSSKQQGAAAKKLKNRSFTKRTAKDAKATVYVRSITDIAGEHMQEMSLYNAMTVPVENISRVFNYQKPNQEKFDADGNLLIIKGDTFKQLFRTVFGDRGIDYLEDFIADINGGNQIREKDMMSGMVSRFKKSAVTGSLSVAIQQPSAIARATALVDPKYFVTKPYSEADYKELLEYCPVAGIKEIGRFDVGTGKTAAEWIIDRERTKLQKADDYLSYLPGWMDRRTWVYIWNAVKRETAAENRGLSQELILEKAAARFRDVIDYTQVYDSTLSRSGYMRRKGSLAKMATAFLAEPTLSYNMLRDGVVNAKGNKAQLGRSIGAFVGATLLNAILKTVITALRHDDDETNYFEVYLSELPQNFIEDLIIVNSLPVVKDLISIAQGYDVSRSDMTLFSNVWNAAKAVTKEGHTPTWDELFALFGSITAFTGIPLNNVMKNLTAVVKTVTGLTKSPDFSWQVLGQTIAEAFSGEKDDSVKLYRAILNENQEIVERYLDIDDKKVKEYVKQGYSEADALKKVMDNTENGFHTNVKKGLVSEDIRIEEAAQALLASDTEGYEALIEELVSCGFDRNDVKGAVDMFVSSMQEKTYSGSETKDKPLYSYDDLFRAIDSKNMTAAKKIFNSLTEGVSEETVQDNLKSEYADDIYNAIVMGNSPETKRLADMFDEFGYDYHYAVILGLRENDERILEAAEARYEGDTEEYERLKADIVADGFDENDVFNAIESETEKLAPKNTASASAPDSSYLYEAADLKRYAVSYNLEATKKAIKNFKDNGKDNGDIRTSLTSAFKKIYIEAWQSKDADTCIKIREFLVACDVGYSSKNFSAWEKEANSK